MRRAAEDLMPDAGLGAWLAPACGIDPAALAARIEQAPSAGALAECTPQIDALVAALHEAGARVARIAALAGELNTRLMARQWALLAPPDLVAGSCLVVMGSEGRREQILKTDQDNALLLRDGLAFDGLEALAVRFGEALGALGYPPCPGHVMISNPLWRQPLARFKNTLHDWVREAQPTGLMNLAIFMDGRAIAGDATLLAEARDFLDGVLDPHDALLARFADVIERFDALPGWWHRLAAHFSDEAVDLKKLGIFPIVHGVRSLALEQRLRATGTAERLQQLVERGKIDAPLARDLLDALHFLMALRLGQQLRCLREGRPAGNLVQPSELGTLERDTLRSALGIVRHFRAVLESRLRLDML